MSFSLTGNTTCADIITAALLKSDMRRANEKDQLQAIPHMPLIVSLCMQLVVSEDEFTLCAV